MPLNNDADKLWVGWLIDDLGGKAKEYQNTLVAALKARNIPKCDIATGTVNMWWRGNSRYIDVTSNLDGAIVTTIHIQEYGTSLWVGRVAESYSQSNYYKRMAAGAFIATVDRCIQEATLTMVSASALHAVSDIGRK